MAEKRKQGRSIGEIIREMIAKGDSFETIKQTLLGLNVPAEQAKILVDLYKLRVSPELEAQIDKMVATKFGFREKAEKRQPVRREASLQRRRVGHLESILKDIYRISFPTPAKRAVIQKIVSDYQEMLARESEMKKELNRVLLEALDEQLPRRDSAKLRRAITDLKEL